jgi:hypothetical protein
MVTSRPNISSTSAWHPKASLSSEADGADNGVIRVMALIFRPEIGFNGEEDAIFWGDEGKKHFRVIIKRQFLMDNFQVKSFFDRAEATQVVQNNRRTFEKLAQEAYEAGHPELIIG